MSIQFRKPVHQFAIVGFLLLVLLLSQPLLGQAMDREDFYRLCIEFPHYAQCRGMAWPPPVRSRPFARRKPYFPRKRYIAKPIAPPTPTPTSPTPTTAPNQP
jgi:hypothetical protein